MKKLFTISLSAFFILFGACTKDFQDINTNPNSPIKVQASLLLRQVIYDYGENMSYEGFVAGNLLGQYFTAIDFNLFDRHNLGSPQVGGNPWPILYRNLRDNQIMLEQAQSNPVEAVYEGPALIMKAYLTANLTDLFGDVPFSEALLGNKGNVTPTYDEQEKIYLGDNGILALLDQGIAAINNYNGTITLQGDILFNGNLANWKRFANSLKIKYLMRISNKVNVSTQLQSVYSENNFIDQNGFNAKFDFSGSEPNNFRMARLRAGDFNLFILSETMEEILKTHNDSRIETFFRPAANFPNEFKGLLNGPDASQTSISVADYSLTGTIFRENTAVLDCNFMTAWETNLLLAEAAERGLIAASAQNLYEMGVTQAFEYWNTNIPNDYLTTGKAAYGSNNANRIEQIITQKWIASIINGYEGWTEFRRTGFPVLKPIAASLNNNLIPTRMPYPNDEAALNSSNYNVAATKTMGNSINAKVWWAIQ